MSLSNHVVVLMAVLVLCAVLLWLIFIEANKFKLNINIDPNLARAYGLGNDIPAKSLRFQLVGSFPQSVQKDWEDAIVNTLRTRNSAITFHLGRRQITCILEQNEQIKAADIRPIDTGDSGFQPAITSYDGIGELCIKFVRPFLPQDCDSSVLVRDERGQKGSSDS